MTQEDLALRSGVARSYMGTIERGDNAATVVTLVQIAGVLDTTAAEAWKRLAFEVALASTLSAKSAGNPAARTRNRTPNNETHPHAGRKSANRAEPWIEPMKALGKSEPSRPRISTSVCVRDGK